jgi:hypothetical protein
MEKERKWFSDKDWMAINNHTWVERKKNIQVTIVQSLNGRHEGEIGVDISTVTDESGYAKPISQRYFGKDNSINYKKAFRFAESYMKKH